jgi:4-amino-4-deoxy-L-arabinose transferase-like glycosyltransferase
MMANAAGDSGGRSEVRYRWILAALVGLALILRLWLLRSVPLIETDGVQYVAIARRFQQSGSPFDPLFHPLFPMGIAVLQPLVGDYELAGRLVSALFGAAWLTPAFVLARALLGAPAAVLAGILMAIHPGLVQSSTAVLSEATYTFWIVLGVWAGRRGLIAPQPGFLGAAGLCFGLAYLARPEGVIYLVGLVVVTAWVGARSHRLRELSPWGVAALAGFLIPAAPYLLYLRRTLGYWTLSGKVLHNLAQDTSAGASGGQSDLGFLLHHAGTTAQRVLENAYLFEKYALPDLFPGLLVLMLFPGLLASRRQDRWESRQGLLLAATLPPFATLAFHIESRVFLPSLPFLLPLAALGILATAEWCARDRKVALWSAGLAAVVVAALLPYSLRPLVRPDPGAMLYRQAAQWIAATQPADVAMMDRKPFVAFYSNRRFIPLARVEPENLGLAAKQAGVHLVILDSRTLVDRPMLLPLLYTSPPPDLEILREFDAGQSGRIRILKVVDRG